MQKWKKKINTIKKQMKEMNSSITSKEWNFIINVLKEQANNNAEGIEYLEHAFLDKAKKPIFYVFSSYQQANEYSGLANGTIALIRKSTGELVIVQKENGLFDENKEVLFNIELDLSNYWNKDETKTYIDQTASQIIHIGNRPPDNSVTKLWIDTSPEE